VDVWSFNSRSPEETLEAGRELGRSIGAEGLAIALIGPLAAGKTVFVKGLAEGLGVDPRTVSSPTFVIAQQYAVPEGPEVLHHVDLYRLESEHELESIGFYDMFAPGAVLAVEWADRFPGVLGAELLSIELEGPTAEQTLPEEGSGQVRTASVTASGHTAQEILADWAERYQRLEDHRVARTGDAHESKDPVSGSRSGTGVFTEMKLGVMIALALTLWWSAQLDLTEAHFPPCEVPFPLESDELGTSRVVCLSANVAAAHAADPSFQDPVELEGVARLLSGQRIDVNRASESLLETLPGIGRKRAEAIVRSRRERPFVSVAELERVDGIGPKIRAHLERFLEVDPLGIGEAIRDG
jgi:tRNA threonylcarbamoyladenosine biosynthesis protein TsaE